MPEDKPSETGPEQPMQIPDGVSPLRFILDATEGRQHVSFRNLDEARQHPNVALVMEADTGGQILFSCPVSRIHCSEATLEQLLHDLANISWGDGSLDQGNGYYDEEGMYYELLPVGSGVSGGMGVDALSMASGYTRNLRTWDFIRRLMLLLPGTNSVSH